MRVEMRSVDASSSQTVVVDSPIGRFAATWQGPAPAVGDVVDAEIDCTPCRWTEVVIGIAAGEPPPGSLRGVIERVESDGVAVLHAGPAITLLEMVGPQPDGLLGARVAIPAREIRPLPTNLQRGVVEPCAVQSPECRHHPSHVERRLQGSFHVKRRPQGRPSGASTRRRSLWLADTFSLHRKVPPLGARTAAGSSGSASLARSAQQRTVQPPVQPG